MEQNCLFGPKFLEKLVGKNILYDPKTAIVELIANAWDAGASEVKITWPTKENEQLFSIEDNGEGLTESEFLFRWRTLAYDRIGTQGNTIAVNHKNRTVFGKNGVGRFAGFCFGDSYFVSSKKNEGHFEYEVQTGTGDSPFILKKTVSSFPKKHSGTKIFIRTESKVRTDEVSIRSEIGMRFLVDPNFICTVNGKKVDFLDIPKKHIERKNIKLASEEEIEVIIIETSEADKTTKQHGIAWHVNGRLVGEADWKSYEFGEIVDGRSSEAKRHTFIINADHLASSDSVKHDWSGFNDSPEFEEVRSTVYELVKEHILGQTEQKRADTLSNIKASHEKKLKELTPYRAERWENFVTTIQEECQSISEKDLFKLSDILINLEQSDTKYSLISKLSELDKNQLNDLNKILCDWSLDLAKEVLDELQIRLKLLDEIKSKVLDSKTKEVQELQPLFHQGLWIFGPEYETIEFTSNEGMTSVIQKIFKRSMSGSRNRPDFAISTDSTVGSYSYHRYGDDGGEIGIERLVIVELKKPGIPISTDEKAQCWKYVSELMRSGLIDRETHVQCFVLGSEVDPLEIAPRKENTDRCIIQPLNYQVVIARAKSRLLKLYDKVKGAPFLEIQREKTDEIKSQELLELLTLDQSNSNLQENKNPQQAKN